MFSKSVDFLFSQRTFPFGQITCKRTKWNLFKFHTHSHSHIPYLYLKIIYRRISDHTLLVKVSVEKFFQNENKPRKPISMHEMYDVNTFVVYSKVSCLWLFRNFFGLVRWKPYFELVPLTFKGGERMERKIICDSKMEISNDFSDSKNENWFSTKLTNRENFTFLIKQYLKQSTMKYDGIDLIFSVDRISEEKHNCENSENWVSSNLNYKF